MNNPKLQYQSQSAAELSCAICKRGFQPNEMRQHTIELSADKTRVLKQSVVHVTACLDQHQELEKKALCDRVVPATRHVPPLLTKQSEWLEKNYSHFMQIAKLYPEAVIYPATLSTGTNSGYWLDVPQTTSTSTELCHFSLNQFKALFTVVIVFQFQLVGARALEFMNDMKTKLGNNSELKNNCSCWLWAHQVAGTGDTFRLVAVLQPLEKELVQAFNRCPAITLHNTEVQLEAKLNEPFQTKHEPLAQSIEKAIQLVQQQLYLCANALKLTPPNLVVVHSTSMSYGQSAVRDRRQQTRFRFHFNCQSSQNGEQRDFYVFPHSDIQSTDLLYYIGKTAEPVPLFYDNVQETEREMERAGLTKQLLTNYQFVMAYYPRSSIKPTRNPC